MILISHRGNIEGKQPKYENKPKCKHKRRGRSRNKKKVGGRN